MSRAWNSSLQGIAFGGDYNPEQWPEEVWSEDAALMREAGVTLVSLGIFSWAVVEPEPGQYDFGPIDRAMDLLSGAGVRVTLATMTASPPPWLAHRHPETLPRRADGTVLWPGARQQYCPSSPVYRSHAAALVERLAERYGDHPALALWHIGNEYGCHVGRCYCDMSAADFRAWLAARYGDVDALNEAWSTTFWSQRYSSLDEVLPPRTAPTFRNPAHEIDFAEFSSDALRACFLMEKEIVARITPEIPVTTNFIPMSRVVDPARWALDEDVVSYDSYPDPADPDAHLQAALWYDQMRSLRDGQPWMLMEQAPSAVNWRPTNLPKPPGAMRLWSWQAVAQGADAVMYFQWRQSRGGAEKFHSAMVPHGGTGTRTFGEVRDLGAELRRAADVVDGRSEADVAIMLDWRSWWGLQGDAHPAAIDLVDAVRHLYRPLFEATVTCDIVPPGRDLSGYRLVVVPHLYLMSDETGAALTSFVEQGGHLLVTYFSGIADRNDRVHLGRYPGPLREVLGLTVEEFWPLPGDETIPVTLDGTEAEGSHWSEVIRLEGATAVGSFDRGPAGGPAAAVTRHAHGAGTAWYVATRLDRDTERVLLERIAGEAGVRPVLASAPAGVQATLRVNDSGTFLFLLNHSADDAEIRLPRPGYDLLTDGGRTESVTLAHRGVAVVRLEDA